MGKLDLREKLGKTRGTHLFSWRSCAIGSLGGANVGGCLVESEERFTRSEDVGGRERERQGGMEREARRQ